MCEILFIQKLNGTLSKQELKEFAKQGVEASFTNSNAWGAFNELGKTIRCSARFTDKHIKKLSNYFEGSKQLVLHLRLATSGDRKLAHPFWQEGFLLCHNGIVNSEEFADSEIDSKEMLRLIAESKEATTVAKIKEALKDVRGSVSVFLQDEVSNLYYFKNTGASFTFAYVPSRNLIVGATSEERVKEMFSCNRYGFIIRDKSIKLKPKNDKIYLVDLEQGLIETGEFSTKPYTYVSNVSKPTYFSTEGYYNDARNQLNMWMKD